MDQTAFPSPVLLRLKRTDHFEARTPLEALDYLRRHWPAGRTAHYRWAHALCDAASKGRSSPEDARRALIDAAQRAGLLVSAGPTDSDFAERAADIDVLLGSQARGLVRGAIASIDGVLASSNDFDPQVGQEPTVAGRYPGQRLPHPLPVGGFK